MMRFCWLLCLLVLTTSSNFTKADEWNNPLREHWSSNRRFVLRVDWKQGRLVLRERSNNGFRLIWVVLYPKDKETDLPAPVQAHITNDGRYVILRDQWGRVGYGKVLTFLGQKGKVLASYTLEQLLPRDEILNLTHTMSSIWWSDDALFFFREEQTQFAFITRNGTIRLFDVSTGRLLPLSSVTKEAIRNEAIKLLRQDLTCSDPNCRARAAILLGTLGDKASIPNLKRLLNDPSASCMIIFSGKRRQKVYKVQLAAGEALVKLLGEESVPLIDAKLPGTNSYMTLKWIELLGKTGAAPKSRKLPTLLKSRDPEIRRAAFKVLKHRRAT